MGIGTRFFRWAEDGINRFQLLWALVLALAGGAAGMSAVLWALWSWFDLQPLVIEFGIAVALFLVISLLLTLRAITLAKQFGLRISLSFARVDCHVGMSESTAAFIGLTDLRITKQYGSTLSLAVFGGWRAPDGREFTTRGTVVRSGFSPGVEYTLTDDKPTDGDRDVRFFFSTAEAKEQGIERKDAKELKPFLRVQDRVGERKREWPLTNNQSLA